MKGWIGIISACLFLFIFSSCQKTPNYNYGIITATINNSIFKSTTVGEARISPDSGQYAYNFGAVDSAATLDFILPVLSTGTYYFGLTAYGPYISYNSGCNYYKTITPSNTPTTGAIIVTSTGNNSLSGTFSGVLYNQSLASDSVIIKNGIFTNCSY